MQPQQPSAFASTSTSPEQPGTRTRTVVLSLVAGLVLGAAGMGAVWALSADSNSPVADGTAAADARAACGALDGFDPEKYTAKGPAGEVALNRYAAAGALSASAAAGDPKYKELAQTIRRSQERHAQVFIFDATVKKDLAKAREICLAS
ncbi:hypothetical protein [Streptomyces sp. 2131.1]|uniref:hypothetical protein n=1 Tax=Streptomyces sp. 2131.1 TaxID=1855346 RepID=UPI0015A390F1|nr:hypothetical protein [Streptomyces sp. 2131.1]